MPTLCRPGSLQVSAKIDGDNIRGCPMPLRLISGSPDLSRTEVTGPGLSKAIAGKVAHFRLTCRDQFGNPAKPGSHLLFEMGLRSVADDTKAPVVEGKNKKADATVASKRRAEMIERMNECPPLPYEGVWGEDGVLEVRYVSKIAGDLELHLWCTNTSTPESGREMLPGSPFAVASSAGRAHAAGSHVSGFARAEGTDVRQGLSQPGRTAVPEVRRVEADRRAAQALRDSVSGSNLIHAGDALLVRPKICDKLGNDTAAPPGELSVMLETAEGETIPIEPVVTVRHGLTQYELRYEPRQVGNYAMHVHLSNSPIAGSPVAFECIPGLPDVSKSTFEMPHQEVRPRYAPDTPHPDTPQVAPPSACAATTKRAPRHSHTR